MDFNDKPVSSSEEDSLQTQPLTPPVSDASDNTTPPAKPPRSADIPPDPVPRPPEREWPYHAGLSLASAREQAIQHWNFCAIYSGSRILLCWLVYNYYYFKFQTSRTYLKFKTSNLPPLLSATLRHGTLCFI